MSLKILNIKSKRTVNIIRELYNQLYKLIPDHNLTVIGDRNGHIATADYQKQIVNIHYNLFKDISEEAIKQILFHEFAHIITRKHTNLINSFVKVTNPTKKILYTLDYEIINKWHEKYSDCNKKFSKSFEIGLDENTEDNIFKPTGENIEYKKAVEDVADSFAAYYLYSEQFKKEYSEKYEKINSFLLGLHNQSIFKSSLSSSSQISI
jgi:hypothetical protein